jgi:hypothetical protein
MSFNPNPTGYFPGILNLMSGDTVSTSGVFLPYSSLESYNPTTSGDIRQLIYSVVEAFSDTYSSLTVADRPTKLVITKTSSVPNDNTIRNSYVITANLTYGDLSIGNE